MTTFIPRRINAKASKAGKTYWEIETDQGNATAFDYSVVQEIEKNIGKTISMYDLETNEKGFINIRPHRAEQVNPRTQQPVKAESEDFAEARKLKDQSIYTSYAKDIFIALIEDGNARDSEMEIETMHEAIALVKQAKQAFN